MADLGPVSPEDCAVLLGIALDDNSIAVERTVAGTLAGSLTSNADRDQFLDDADFIAEALACFDELGVIVPSSLHDRYAPVDLETVCAVAKGARVLSFITHHDSEHGLQLGNRFVSLPELAEAIAPVFRGVVDFGACETRPELHGLRQRYRGIRWVGFDGGHRFDARASILRIVHRNLRNEPSPYVDVLFQALHTLQLASGEFRT